MTTQELLQEIQQFQSDYIQNIPHWDLYDAFWDKVYNEYSGCDDSTLSFSNDTDEVWRLMEPGFQSAYEAFKTELLAKYPVLASNGWDGTLSFYTEVWNRHATKLFYGASDPEFVNLGESPDGGSYFFNINGYTEENVVAFTKAADGAVLMEYAPYSSSSDDGSY